MECLWNPYGTVHMDSMDSFHGFHLEWDFIVKNYQVLYGFHGLDSMESTWNRYLELIKWNLIYIYIIAYINYNTNTVIKHIYEGVKGVGEGERDSPGGGGGVTKPRDGFRTTGGPSYNGGGRLRDRRGWYGGVILLAAAAVVRVVLSPLPPPLPLSPPAAVVVIPPPLLLCPRRRYHRASTRFDAGGRSLVCW
jgi:hypothetical protein